MSQNIYQRINEVRRDVEYIQKDAAVSTGRSSYRAVTHDNVTAHVRKSFIEHGIVLEVSQMFGEIHPKEPEAKQRLYEASYSVSFVNIDNPDDRMSVVVHAHAMDNADKSPGKAMSMATKYAILKTCMLETGENEESRTHVDSPITNTEIEKIRSLLKSTKTDEQAFIDHLKKSNFGGNRLSDLFGDWVPFAISALDNKAKSNAR